MSAARFFVHGRVQGVWFRAATREQAQALQLVGYARNLPDHSVEVLAFGPAEKLALLEAWLAIGPPLAKVTEVLRQPVADVGPPDDFSIA